MQGTAGTQRPHRARLTNLRASWVGPALLTLVLYASLGLLAGASDGYRFLSPTRVGAAYAQPGVLLPGQRAAPGTGYDGQFNFYLAQDPFLRRPATLASLDSGFRYRRLLYPFAAWLLAGGQRGLVPYTLVLVNVLAATALVAVAAAWARRHGRSPWAALSLTFFAGLWVPVVMDLNEPLHLALLAAGVALSSAGLLFLSAMARELGALVLATESVRALRARAWRSLFAHAGFLALFVAWSAFAAVAVNPGRGDGIRPWGTGNPLARLGPLLRHPGADPAGLVVVGLATAMLALCLVRLAWYRDRLTWPAAIYALVVVFSGTMEPDPASAFRLIAGPVVLTFMAWSIQGDRAGRWLLVLAGSSGAAMLALVLMARV